MTPVVTLEGVAKRYWQLSEPPMLLRAMIPFARPRKEERWALRGIDLRVDEGETVGMIGRNGAGKTTLLRLLAGVSRPTTGEVHVRGRIAPLIGVGVGFHQEMTGRENVFVNGLLLGLTKRQIAERFEQIIDFAELWDFVDTPVKFYSSGMFMRLGFAVAVHSTPDLLLVDEVLAVGDLAFQVKCIDRMRQLQSSGTTILLVSHSMPAVRLLCPRAVLIDDGRIVFDGPTESAIARHHELLTREQSAPDGTAAVTIDGRCLRGAGGPTHHPLRGERLTYSCRLHFHRPVDTPQVHFEISSDDGAVAYSVTSDLKRDATRYQAGDSVDLEIGFDCRLGAGTYRLQVTVTDRSLRDLLAHDAPGFMFFVAAQPGRGGIADLAGDMAMGGRRVSDVDHILMKRPAAAAE